MFRITSLLCLGQTKKIKSLMLSVGFVLVPMNVNADDLYSIIANVDSASVSYELNEGAANSRKQDLSAYQQEKISYSVEKEEKERFNTIWQKRVLGVLAHRFVNEVLPDLQASDELTKRFDAGTFSVEIDISSPEMVYAIVYDMSGGEVTTLKIPANKTNNAITTDD